MDYLDQKFSVQFEYKVFFTNKLFESSNDLLLTFLKEKQSSGAKQKLIFVVDKGVIDHHGYLLSQIKEYFGNQQTFKLIDEIIVIPGGEHVKNDAQLFYELLEKVNQYGIDRHSYLVAIGGGSVLDLAGYVAAVSHRGIRHIRIPTTVLSQNDSGVGVKNGINFFGKKNFLGTFAPPAAVFNDAQFLTTLEERDWRSGISEAVKVALIKDAAFFEWLEANVSKLVAFDLDAMKYLVKRCADLHLQHIAGKDPFETGSSRPLDFGHWSAHKLEQLTEFSIRHGEAVAMGIAMDSVYSHLSGRLSENDRDRIINLLKALGFQLTHPMLAVDNDDSPILKGLNEFREHLGGKLTIMLLSAIGTGEEVFEIDHEIIKKTSAWLQLND